MIVIGRNRSPSLTLHEIQRIMNDRLVFGSLKTNEHISYHERQKLGYLSVNTFQTEQPPPTTHHHLPPAPLDGVGAGAGTPRTYHHQPSSPTKRRQIVAHELRFHRRIFLGLSRQRRDRTILVILMTVCVLSNSPNPTAISNKGKRETHTPYSSRTFICAQCILDLHQ